MWEDESMRDANVPLYAEAQIRRLTQGLVQGCVTLGAS
jgi:hypothetical protein